MKKAFDQTIRDLKREVNKKVLKVPSIEQKVLDATSNEPWGPHGTLLADMAQATRNYHEYQMIMTVIWKRINSTGKNWRHVYKALTVLEYMVANGSERVVDDIREHAYQISTLSSFQYIDSSGRDQGLNVRRKSQSLVSLVNDKEKIQEVREKAAANREKFRSSTMGGAYRPGSSSGSGYDDDRYGYGREGEWGGNRDDDRYGRYADSYGRDSDRYGRDSEERYGRGSYKDEDSRGRSVDENQYGSRSSDRDRDQAYDDEHNSSRRGSSVKAEDHPSEGRPIERKFSEQNLGAPPSYEDAIGGSKSPVYSERDGETPVVPAPVIASPAASTSPGQTTANLGSSWSEPNYKADAVDEFDPRVPQPAVPVASNNAEMDLIGSLSDSLAITTVSTVTSADPDASEMFAQSNFMTTSSTSVNQSFDDPFGDSPFKAIRSSDDIATTQAQSFASASSFQPSIVNNVEQPQQVIHNTNSFGTLEVAESFSGLTFNNTEASAFQHPPNSQPTRQGSLPFENDDILAGILPPSGPLPPAASQAPFPPPTNQPTMPFSNAPNLMAQPWSSPSDIPYTSAQNLQKPPTASNSASQVPTAQTNSMNTHPHTATGRVPQQNNNVLDDLLPQTRSLALVPQPAVKEKFEPKSAVWADTLNRGLVNLDISGSKVNPNSDIGIDFESLNRKEKRMEKPTAASTTSTISMGKAMGSGSGMGRSGAGIIRPHSNPMMGSGLGMGGAPGVGMGMGMGGVPGVGMGTGMRMGGAPGVGMGMGGASGVGMGIGGASGVGTGMGGASGVGMGMGGYGAMNQRPNMGLGMGGNVGMGMSQGVPMQAPNGLHPGSNMSGAGGYNPMMGRGGYPQQPYGSGYQ